MTLKYISGELRASQLAQINIDIEQLDDQYDARMGENESAFGCQNNAWYSQSFI